MKPCPILVSLIMFLEQRSSQGLHSLSGRANHRLTFSQPRPLFLSENCNEENFTRRTLLSSIVAGTAAAATLAPPADAAVKGAKGAAEYDMEFYLRDLLKGNTREGNLPASAAPSAPPPRKLGGGLLPLLLDNSCSQDCMPARVLSTISGMSAESITDKMSDYRTKASKAFISKAKWENDDVSDQYYFDLTAYALWRTAADLIPNFVQRDKFAKDIGRGIYKESKQRGLLLEQLNQKEKDNREGAPNGSLTGTIPAVLEILDLFKSTQFCLNYRLGGDDSSRTGQSVFDELDDEDIQDGASVNCLISVYQPAMLGASLQITGEGSRFSPEFVGSTLSAMWEEAGITASFETYFVDQEYRPNPKDFFPDEQLLQFTLTRKK